MNNSVRKSTLYFLLVLMILFLVVTAYFTFIYLYENSKNKMLSENALASVEKRFMDRIYFYDTAIKALATNPLMQTYAFNENNEQELQNLFLHMKKTLPDLFQVRYLDKNGLEKIRVDGKAISFYGEEANHFIQEKHLLQNKSDKDYFQHFISLKPYEVGLSDIDLNSEFGKISLPKEPTCRMGIAIYGDKKSAQGVIIFNISLRYIFSQLTRLSLYKVSIVDGDGKFILHQNSRFGLIGDDSEYSLKDELPNNYKQILESNEYASDRILSKKINNFDEHQKLFIVLQKKEVPLDLSLLFLNTQLIVMYIVASFIILILFLMIAKNKS